MHLYTQLPDGIPLMECPSTLSDSEVIDVVEWVRDVLTVLSLRIESLEERLERATLTSNLLDKQGHSLNDTSYYRRGHVFNIKRQLNVLRYDFKLYFEAYNCMKGEGSE